MVRQCPYPSMSVRWWVAIQLALHRDVAHVVPGRRTQPVFYRTSGRYDDAWPAKRSSPTNKALAGSAIEWPDAGNQASDLSTRAGSLATECLICAPRLLGAEDPLAAHIGGSARGYQALLASLAIAVPGMALGATPQPANDRSYYLRCLLPAALAVASAPVRQVLVG